MERSDPEMHALPCATVRKVVYEFLDEELPPAEALAVDRHLALCPPCAGLYIFERAYLLVLKRGAPIDAAPAELRERIRAALARRKRQGPVE